MEPETVDYADMIHSMVFADDRTELEAWIETGFVECVGEHSGKYHPYCEIRLTNKTEGWTKLLPLTSAITCGEQKEAFEFSQTWAIGFIELLKQCGIFNYSQDFHYN